MKRVELKVARIGNSRGIRIPSPTLKRYEIGDTIIMEERAEGILLRPDQTAIDKLSWEETARQMATAQERWHEWDAVLADGLDEIPWERARKVAEPRSSYVVKRRRK